MPEPFRRRPSPDGAPGLLTTTCRFDRDLFARIEQEAGRLGVSNSEVIRLHVREGIERRAAERAVGRQLADHATRIARLERIIRFITTRGRRR
ncbi:hypothetical protein Q5424_05005 [Conexibacter sp. JD483]|uniref:hypothetical protein n=1 Tax=unclassified Conexibacter TaxID=2627773 RepID=UPI002720E1CD|nr:MULTISPECIES: hypothetical protein [unclassified Conexibacter]MDO8184692.1 hypothetical protein [Conexibacter sp. CPCC 205706]MDO8197998.1 hypothetical protein [Conexibacter sp. CPCC 205762]MDR9368428.1 hypothetical protein [Conexibacter sp. JD483]